VQLLKPRYPSLQVGHPLAQGLVAGWVMAEGAGQHIGDIGTGNFWGTLQGLLPTWIGSPLGASISFNGTSTYATINGTLWTPGTANQSWLAWVIPTSSAARGFVAGQDDLNNTARAVSFLINSQSNGTISAGNWTFGYSNAGGTQFLIADVRSNVVKLNKVNFLAGVRTGASSVAMYRDGIVESYTLRNSNAVSVPALSAVRIGERNATGAEDYFPGQILQVLHFNRALSPSEIMAFQLDPFVIVRQPRTPQNVWAGAPIAGTLTQTLTAATLSSAGALQIAGTVSQTLGAATLTATGALPIAGTAAQTLGAATLAAAGAVQIAGTLSETLAGATTSAAATLALSGSANSTLGNATASAAGTLLLSGALSRTLADAALAAEGLLPLTGALGISLDGATVAATGASAIGGSLTVTLGNATVLARGRIGDLLTPRGTALVSDARLFIAAASDHAVGAALASDVRRGSAIASDRK
jgi:hypothetical protein